MSCQRVLNSGLGWAENNRFLEQFRYTIIASQLLNDVPSSTVYKRQTPAQGSDARLLSVNADEQMVAFSWSGTALTVLAAFAFAWSVHWTRNYAQSTTQRWPLLLIPIIAVITCLVLYVYFRRQWLHWLRTQAVESASTLVVGAQNLDAAVSASVNMIQEVELICRGYRM